MLGVGIAAAGLAIGIGVKAVQAAAEYQSAMTQLQNTTGSSDAQMQQYTATIRSLSDTTGKSQVDLAKGMYQIVSANFAGADATRILTTATQAAIIAGADQTQVTTGLVVTLNAFHLQANQVDSVSNRMFKTLSLGRGQMNDLAGALQTGGALVAHYGVSVTDMDATLATLSTGGMKTFGTSMTGLTQLLNVMDGKTDLLTGRLHKLHINFDEGKFKAMDYQDQIAYLTAAFKGHEKQMVAVLGSKQAATALGILGTQSQLLTSNLHKLGDAHQLVQDKTTAWSRVQGDFNFQWDKFKTNMQNLLIDLGLKLLPYLTPVVKQFSDWAVILQYRFVPWLSNAVTDITHFVYWLQQGSGPAQALKGLLEGIGLAIAAMKVAQVAKDIADMAKNAADFVVGAGKNLLSYFTGDLTGAADTAGKSVSAIGDDAEANVGKVQGAAVKEEVALEETGATADTTAASVTGIGTAAEADVPVVEGAATKMSTALEGVLGLASKLAGLSLLGSQWGASQGAASQQAQLDQAANLGSNKAWLQYEWEKIHGFQNFGKMPDYHSLPNDQKAQIAGDWYKTHSGQAFPWSTAQGFASGVTNFSGGLAYVHGGEVLSNLAPGTNVTPASRVSLGGGPVFNISISTMAGSRSEIMRMVDLLEAEIAARFRGQTPGFGFGGIV